MSSKYSSSKATRPGLTSFLSGLLTITLKKQRDPSELVSSRGSWGSFGSHHVVKIKWHDNAGTALKCNIQRELSNTGNYFFPCHFLFYLQNVKRIIFYVCIYIHTHVFILYIISHILHI